MIVGKDMLTYTEENNDEMDNLKNIIKSQQETILAQENVSGMDMVWTTLFIVYPPHSEYK